MGFYEGYKIFRELEGKIEIKNFMLSKGLITILGSQPLITINNNLSLEEQVKTFIHELIHLEYKNWKHLTPGCLPEDHPAEIEIEKETQETYNNNPILVKHLREKLQEVRYKK